MKIKAALYNADHLEYGLVTIPFPISRDQYDDTIKMLEALDIGDPRARDCTVEEIEGSAPSLKCLEGRRINVDELDYMVKRLDSFSDGELAQFQGMAVKMGLSDMTDLINLTFCCQHGFFRLGADRPGALHEPPRRLRLHGRTGTVGRCGDRPAPDLGE